MNRSTIFFLCLIAMQNSQIQSWWHPHIDKIVDTIKSGANDAKNKASDIANAITNKIPSYLYYIPNFKVVTLGTGITNMSISCNEESFVIIDNGTNKQPQLFTRLAKLGESNNTITSLQGQKNAGNGLYFRFSFDSSSNKLTVTTSDSFIKLSDIGTATFQLHSKKTPTQITCNVNGKSKTFNIGKKLYVVPLLN